MERFLVIAMILSGAAIATLVSLVLARSASRASMSPRRRAEVEDLESIASSIVFSIARMAGTAPDAEIIRRIRDQTSLPDDCEQVDVAVWADAFRRRASRDAARSLLENAVKVAVSLTPVLPLAQYNALLELSFALGFQTDALARLRARYRFEYVDYARDRRPREADQGGRQVFFRRAGRDRSTLLAEMGLTDMVDRAELIGRYRRLAAEVHPDRFHGATAEERVEASERFIRLTEAYEALLAEIDWGD